MILEIRLLRFSTGQPHPLAEQPTIFITTKAVFIGYTVVNIEIVGDFLALLITFNEGQDENEDMFFLVRWKKGETYHVSVSGLQHGPHAASHRLYFVFSFGALKGEPAHILVSSRKTLS
jgi:hypothetical protein